jgi:hypothetical protein
MQSLTSRRGHGRAFTRAFSGAASVTRRGACPANVQENDHE